MKTVLHVLQFPYPWEIRASKVNQALRRAGFRVAIVARQRDSESLVEPHQDGAIYRAGPAGLLSLPVPGNGLWSRAIRRAIREARPAVIVVRDIPLMLTAARAARSRGIPVLLDMAEHYPEAMRSWKKYASNPVLRLLVHRLRVPDMVERSAVAAAHGIIVVCEEQRERLTRMYGYAPDRIRVVMNTPELQSVERSDVDSSAARRFRFAYHGILCDDRELEVVLRGFDIAAQHLPDITLLLAGGGESEQDLRKLAATLSCRDRIRFTGTFTPDQLPALYAETDFGVVALRRNEFSENTVGNKFFDYAALGKPFIFPDIKPLSRLMERMDCGVSFAPGCAESAGRAIVQIREADYGKMGANGIRSILDGLNWEVDTANLCGFVESYMSDRNRP